MSDCRYCGVPFRRRRVGCDARFLRVVCGCAVPLIECWRELLEVHDRVMQQPRKSVRKLEAAS